MRNNKSRILIMLPWSEFFLGTEQFMYAMVVELLRREYSVDIFSYLKKVHWEFLRTTGATLLDNDVIEDKYDLAIINGNNCLIKAPKSAFKIFISHGTVPSVEIPIPGADRYVSISQEVQYNLKKYAYDSIIIRNGIDCERFKSVKKINKKLKTVLVLNNQISQDGLDFKIINEVCNEMNLTLLPLGLGCGTSQWETEGWINESDLVISMGRGIYEA
ncbi:MAG: hypothetical protein AABY22_25825, partial [Nanoarchaeota archaeon]